MNTLEIINYYYCCLFALILTVAGLLSGFAITNLIVTTLFLPVCFYFIFDLVRAYYAKKLLLSLTPPPPAPNPQGSFHLETFLTQKNPTFFITLSLYGLLLFVLICKASLSYLPRPDFVSPVPTTFTSQ